MNMRRIDLAVATTAVACAIVACAAPWIPLRTVAAAPLCLVLPGYSLTRAVFARSEAGAGPSQAMRMTFALALSLSTLILGSVGLDLAPGGLQRTSWALLLGSVTALASTVSLVRRRHDTTAEEIPRLIPRAQWGSVFIGVLAGVIAVTAFVASRITWPAPNAIGYTQLWILPAAGGKAVNIGVECDQLDVTGYRLVVTYGQQMSSWRSVLRPGRSWDLTVPVNGAESGYVTVTLFRDGHAGSYRQVRLHM
jgi:uncharacterized membrane protein